jgi:signal transduction histidine kinase
MTGFITDITDRKKIEELKDEFISNVSHELRTPLTSLRGSLGLILSGVCGNVSEEVHNLIDIANQNCERLILLINDILDIQKIESGKIIFDFKDIHLRVFLEKALKLNKAYGEKFKVEFTLIEPIEDGYLYADEDRLMQVLTNLLSNAAKFSPQDQIVEVYTEARQPTWIRIAVKDHGSGIPTTFQSSVFAKFAQADTSNTKENGGSGLGLNISKSIVEQLGGQISFQTSSHGTIFYVDLPFRSEERRRSYFTTPKDISLDESRSKGTFRS